MDILVVDNLNSTDKYSALSANQGRVLHQMIIDIQNNVATDAEIDALFAE